MSFNNPSLVTQSWYVAARSRQLRAGQAKSFDVLRRRITIYRDEHGVAHAIDARCPHLGADLGHGTVAGDSLRCAFHGWRFGPDGTCRQGSRSTRAYPAVERWGLIWIFNGRQPLFDLPDPPDTRLRALRLPSQRINCHPHLVIANGLDITHYDSLHGMDYSEPPQLTRPAPHRLSVSLRGRPRARWQQILTGTWARDIIARFTTIGGSMAWATVEAPLRFHMLFAGRPDVAGGCETQTVLFCEPRHLPRAVALMYLLLHDDHRILNDIRFAPHFVESDAPLKAFAELVDSLGSW